MVLGIDEVGRGPLAGPMVVAGFLLDESYPLYTYDFLKKELEPKEVTLSSIAKINSQGAKETKEFYEKKPIFQSFKDSKRLSQKKREMLSEFIMSEFQDQVNFIMIGSSAQNIDKYGLGVCLSNLVIQIIKHFENDFHYYKKGIADSKTLSDISRYTDNQDYKHTILLDGNIKLPKDFAQNYNINKEPKSDDKYLSVAMASIIAKVYRDNIMKKLDKSYPEYNWSQNKGYGTKKHRDAIKNNPKNPHLRQSFLSNILAK